MRPALIVFLVTAVVAEISNVVCHTFFGDRPPVANMFNITPYHPSTQPVFPQIALSLGVLPEILLYLFVEGAAVFIIDRDQWRHPPVLTVLT